MTNGVMQNGDQITPENVHVHVAYLRDDVRGIKRTLFRIGLGVFVIGLGWGFQLLILYIQSVKAGG